MKRWTRYYACRQCLSSERAQTLDELCTCLHDIQMTSKEEKIPKNSQITKLYSLRLLGKIVFKSAIMSQTVFKAKAPKEGYCVGCPRNNQIFFSVRTKTNRNSICFGCFSVCFAKPKNIFFGLFRCFGSVLKQPKQTQLCQNKQKNLQKTFYIRGSSKQLIFFSRFEPKQTETQSVSVVFRFLFFKTK